MRCPSCRHEWLHRGKTSWICCPNCRTRFRRPPAEAIEASNLMYFIPRMDTETANSFLAGWIMAINSHRTEKGRRPVDEIKIRSYLAEYGETRLLNGIDQEAIRIRNTTAEVIDFIRKRGLDPAVIGKNLTGENEESPE